MGSFGWNIPYSKDCIAVYSSSARKGLVPFLHIERLAPGRDHQNPRGPGTGVRDARVNGTRRSIRNAPTGKKKKKKKKTGRPFQTIRRVHFENFPVGRTKKALQPKFPELVDLIFQALISTKGTCSDFNLLASSWTSSSKLLIPKFTLQMNLSKSSYDCLCAAERLVIPACV